LQLIADHRSPSQLSRPHWDFDNQNNNYRSLQLMMADGGGIWFGGVASEPPKFKPQPHSVGVFSYALPAVIGGRQTRLSLLWGDYQAGVGFGNLFSNLY